ncbi:MAG TPA: hypothetical protein VLW50_22805 [Streptosporangiaceae bacterium]|nr:hypothetical protein [Streptosporangiaceae bacterium]
MLLLAVAAAFLLPWSRLPPWTSVLVPLVYTGSILALILAAGATSGVGIVILIPLVWTALFHRRWESSCIVAAIVAVEVIISLTPVAVPDSVVVRRVLLWASLGALISVAAHGLRDRIRRSQEESTRLQNRLRELTVLEDRDRIAAELRDKVIGRIMAAALTLQSAASLTTQGDVRRRVGASVDDLDQAIRAIRDTVFGLEHKMQGRGLRQQILDLCGELSPVPEISFSGPVDRALHPSTGTQLLEILREALSLIGQRAIPARIGIAAGDESCLTTIEAGPMPHIAEMKGYSQQIDGLRDSATQAGVRISIEPIPDGTRFTWRVPLIPPVRSDQS